MIGLVTVEARDRQNAAIVAKSADDVPPVPVDEDDPDQDSPGVDDGGDDVVKAAGPLTTMSEHSDFQGPLSSAPGVTLRSDTTGAPIGSSFHEHAAGMSLEVQQAGYQEAADRGRALLQMGPRRPSGLPGQPAEHVAPTGVGARFRQNMPQAAHGGGATYLPGTIGGSY